MRSGKAATATLRDAGGRIVCARCRLATTMLGRTRGLLGRSSLAADEGLYLDTGSVHTFFMRFPIDVVFLDRGLRVVGVARDLRPWRAAWRRGARSVVELPAGAAAAAGIAPGDELRLEPAAQLDAPAAQPEGGTA
jgi:uncharacterized membrane protein (UPF0127 family)